MMRSVLLTITVLLSSSAGLLASTLYTITDLGFLPGALATEGSSINNAGMVAGTSGVFGGSLSGFVWTPASGMLALPTFGGPVVYATGINSSGQVTGYGYGPVSQSAAAFLYSGGTVQNLGTLGGVSSYGYGINDSGHVTGYSYVAGSSSQLGFIYKDGAMLSIGAPCAGCTSSASGINNSDVITGTAGGLCGGAFVWSNGIFSPLPNFYCAPGAATAINDAGQVAGSMTTGSQEAVLWPNNGSFVYVGNLGTGSGVAMGISSAGQVVGISYSRDSYQPSAAFLYTAGVTYDLNALVVNGAGWHLISANAINDNGQIVGYGTKTGDPYYVTRGFLLTPVPSTPYALAPAVAGLTQAAADAAITGVGLIPGTVQLQASSSVPAATVITGNPVAGVQVAAGSAVNLFVSNGPSSAPAPSCQLTATVNGPLRQIQITVQDTISGLQSIQVVQAVNSSVTFPAFTPGTTNPVMVTATKVDQTQSSSVTLTNTSVTGVIGSCDPVDFTATIEDRQETHAFRNLSSAEHYIRIVNANRGLRSIKFDVNGTDFPALRLGGGETRVLDIGSAMQSGSNNRVIMKATGLRGSSATILIGDASVE